ncbi:MAG: hypothetical protein ACAI38_11340 [Myxococcota bacterium]
MAPRQSRRSRPDIDTQFLQLAAVAVLLYVIELAVYLPPGRVGFVLRGRSVRLIRGLGFKSPFPWGAFYAVDDFYLELGATGALLSRPSRDGRAHPVYLDYAVIKDVTVRETKLFVDGKEVFRAPSAKAAERVKHDLDAIRALPEKKRADAVKKLIAGQIDADKAVEIRKTDDKTLVTLRGFGVLLLLLVAGVIGYLLMGRTERLTSIGLGALALTVFAIGKFISAHAKLWPRERAQRWTRAFTYIYPLALAKSSDVCTHDRMSGLHVLAPMRAFTTPAEQGRMIEAMLADAKAADTSLDNDNADVKRTRAEVHATLMGVLSTIAPAPQKKTAENDDGVVVRCPRCGAGYTRQVSECFDCGAAIEQQAG